MPKDGGSVWLGLLIGVGVSIVAVAVSVALMVGLGGLFLVGGIGIVQALWIVPLYLYFRRNGQKEVGKGVLIVAGLVFLLNASCWGLFLSGGARIGG